jgi:hypothetical protein
VWREVYLKKYNCAINFNRGGTLKEMVEQSSGAKLAILQALFATADYIFSPQKDASGFTSSRPTSHASWSRQTTSASALRPVSG